MTDSTAKRDCIIQPNCETIPDSADKNLSASEYSQMLDSTDEGVVLIQDAKIQYVNSAISRLLGYSTKEATGMPFSELIGPEHLELVVTRYMARLQGEDVPSTYDITLKRKDGTIVPVEIHRSIFEYDGNIASLVMVRDITARQAREKEIRSKLDELESYKKATIGRELKMIELKDEIRSLKEKQRNVKEIGGTS